MRSHLSPSGGHARFAEPIDALHWAETSLRDFVQTLSKTFSQLPIGLAVFDRNRMLHMFNPALAQLTGLPVEFLAARPRLSAVLDALRDLNRLPEPKNYQNWRRELIQMERAAATGAYEDVWNLSDGLSFRVTARPHPDGAIALMIEDITPEMQRSQRYHKDMALGNSVIDAIPDPVAVFNSAGELVMDNPAFAVFGMPGSEPDTDPPQNADVEPASAAIEIVHIRDVANRLSSQTAPTPFWKQLQEFVQTIGDREAWKAQIRLADGRLFNSLVQPLPASATMVLFRAVAVTAPKVRVTEDAKPRQRA
jgi:PAS domain-containing protein